MNKFIKTTVTAVIAMLSELISLISIPVAMLFIASILDYISRFIACYKTGEKITSKKSIEGIFKKISYLIIIMVCIMIDIFLQLELIKLNINYGSYAISILGCSWLLVNEFISILENLNEADIKLPKILLKVLNIVNDEIDKKGDFKE